MSSVSRVLYSVSCPITPGQSSNNAVWEMESETLSSPVINNTAGREDTGQSRSMLLGGTEHDSSLSSNAIGLKDTGQSSNNAVEKERAQLFTVQLLIMLLGWQTLESPVTMGGGRKRAGFLTVQ